MISGILTTSIDTAEMGGFRGAIFMYPTESVAHNVQTCEEALPICILELVF